jgi:hypothetical protein
VPGDVDQVNAGHVLDAANIAHRRVLRVKVSMQRAADGTSPVLERFSMLWSCE